MKISDSKNKCIVEMYRYKNMTMNDIAKEFGTHRGVISKKVKNLEIERCYKDPEWLKTMYHKMKVTQLEMSKLANCHPMIIMKYLKLYGLNDLRGMNARIYDINHHYFDNIDSEEKAYWLGFLLADGFISKDGNSYRMGLSLNRRDEGHIDKLLKAIGSNHPKQYVRVKSPSSNNSYEHCRVRFSSSIMGESLIWHGCTPNKTLKEEPPILRSKLVRHFIRGYFDGDGSIGIYKDNRCNYEYPSMTMIGTKPLLQWICKELKINPKISSQKKLYRFQLSGKSVLEPLNHLYDHSAVFLDRKYQIYQEINSIWKI